MSWNQDEEFYPGPSREPVGWITVGDKTYPVFSYQISTAETAMGKIGLTTPRTLSNGDTMTFTVDSVKFTTS